MLLRHWLRLAVLAAVAASPLAASAAPLRPQVNVTGYVINADLDPANNQLKATAAVTFTSLEDLTQVILELNNGLHIASITDASGQTLSSERFANDSTVHIALSTPMPKGASATWTFTYEGVLKGDETSPVDGIELAAVADPISMLLYAGRWFPMAGFLTDRFTAEMHIRVPAGERVVGSGPSGHSILPDKREQYDFNWTRPGFPGTILAGKFIDTPSVAGAGNIHVYVTDKQKDKASDWAHTAGRQQELFTGLFGQPESGRINVVELPATTTVSAAWGPEILAILPGHDNPRLFANTLAHQWWGSELSPATLNDAWITNGMSRYAELMFVEDSAGETAFQSALSDIAAGALAYDTEPLTTLGRVDPFSPQFQDMTLEKGAMVFHMLRYMLGKDAFPVFLRNLLSQYTDKGVRTGELEAVANAQSKEDLTAFFSQWLNGTGAPTFGDNYTVLRLGNGKGFRTVGSITEDLDLFKMPVDLRIETEGRTEVQRVEVSGPSTPYSVDTFGRPRKISIDPDGWVLKTTPDLNVRVAVLRGQQDLAQGDSAGALTEYQKALAINKNSSLVNYRMGELFFSQRNYQSAANAFLDALRGDLDPKWTEVWSHVYRGMIFDATGQHDPRGANEYRLAIQTNDNTQGAINQARAYLQTPYKPPPQQ